LVQSHTEREDKFEVGETWLLPDVAGLVPDGGSLSEVVHKLESTYFDTSDGALREFGVTLRRRIGGGETGWQLKVPAGSARTELRSRSHLRTVPKELAEVVTGLQGRQELVPVATISTTRSAHRVVDAGGELVFEIADDDVQAATLGSESTLRAWREIEVELGPGGREKTLTRVGKWLTAAGARASRSATKLNRALGLDSSRVKPSGPTNGSKKSSGSSQFALGALVVAYLSEQCEVMVANDIGLRTGAPVVHKTRVAVRRLRSTLRTFADVFDADRRVSLDTELTWYAGLLGGVRDCDVLEARLSKRVAELPAERVLGPVAAHLQESLALDRKAASERLREGMSSERYKDLLGAVRAWRSAPPLTEVATSKPGRAQKYVHRAQQKAAKRLDRAGGDVEQLHRARKAMKRLRYAAELAKSSDRTSASLAHKAKHLQTELGEHQDAVVAATYLARLGAAAGSNSGHNGFTYGLLMAAELATAERIRASLAHK
jgi:CHAD domain-containing protein